MNEHFENLKKRILMEEAKTREQQLVESFQGLSLAETVWELKRIGIKVHVEEGFVILHHPILPSTYEKIYQGTLLKIRGTRK